MINSTIAKKTYTGNAGVLVYPIGFQYMRDALTNAPEIEVLLDGGELTFGTDYTVSDDGLNVILSNAVANGAKIEIYRTTSMLQESDYQVGRISPEQIEKDFDRLAMRDQELAQADEDIATEVALAKARLSIVEGDIDLLEDKDSELENAISEEAENRAHDDGILLEKIEQLSARNEDYRVEAANAIATEAKARSEADTNLQGAIAAEANARSTADTNLQNLISNTNNTVAAVSRAVQNVDAKVGTKQDKLVAGNNIKIEGNVISAEGGSADVSDLENAVSVLRTDVELSTEPFTETVVLLDELYTSEIDGRPDYKKPGATVYAENGAAGIIDTVDETAGTATIVTVPAGGAGGIKQYTSMPVAADVAGEVAQYIGADGDYKHGYFYESVGQSGGTNSYSDFYYDRDTSVSDTDVLFDFVNAALKSGGQSPLAVGDTVAIGFWRTPDLEEYEDKEGLNYIKRTSSGGVSQTVEVTDEWMGTNYPDGCGLDMSAVPEYVSFTVTGIAGTSYVWQELDLAGGAEFPDQTDNAGKFLMTDGITTSWSDKPLVSRGAYSNSLVVMTGGYHKYITTTGEKNCILNVRTYNGMQPITVRGKRIVMLGGEISSGTTITSSEWTVINGYTALGGAFAVPGNLSLSVYGIAAGERSIQFGLGTNNDDNTFKVSNANGNFEIMDADGNVPLERLTYVTGQIGDISTALTAIIGE